MRLFITGGAGFIGSNLVWALLSGGHEVLVVDDLSTGKPENLDPRAGFRKMDILGDELPTIIADFGPEVVVHLAAQASVPLSWQDPERDRAVNAEGTRRVCEAARKASARRVICASSAAVYGTHEDLPVAESSFKAPENPYGHSKLEGEQLVEAELRGSDVDFASMRFSNVYGPRQDAYGEGGVVAVFCSRLAEDKPPVVYGTGKQTRDFIYVADVVGALMAAATSESALAQDGPDGACFNISTGVETTVEQLLMALRQTSGYFGRELREEPREGDIERSSLDPSKAERVFGWTARVTVDQGIPPTWRWFKELA